MAPAERPGPQDIEALLRKLASDDWHGRCKAAEALGKFGDRRAVAPLVRALADEGGSVRRAAVRALQALGDPDAVDGLVETLRRDKDGEVRAAAAWALGWLGDRAAVPALVEALLDESENTDSNALASLERLGEPVRPRLLAMLQDPEERVRASAAGLLFHNPSPDLIDLLAAALWDTNDDVRTSAAQALGKLGEAGLAKLLDAARDPSPDARAAALFGIWTGTPIALPPDAQASSGQPFVFLSAGPIPRKRPVDPRRVSAVLAGLDDSAPEVRRTAAIAAGELGLAEAAPLLARLVDDLDVMVADSARSALGQLGKGALVADVRPEEAETLGGAIALLRYPDATVRLEAARFLGRLGDARAAVPLLRALRDEMMADATDELTQILAGLGEPALEVLLAAARDEQGDPRLRTGAITALGAFRGTRALDALLALLKHADSAVRRAAASGLGRSGDARAFEPLRAALDDSEARRAAAFALVELGDPAGIDEVLASVREENYPSTFASRALLKLGERAIEPMGRALANENESVQEVAKDVLCGLPHPRSVELLIQVLEKKLAPSLYGVDHCLIHMGDVAVEPLLAVLHDRTSRGRDRAAYALGAMGDPRAFEPLLRIAADEDEDIEVRKMATFFLAGFKDERAVPVLERLAKSENESLRGYALRQLVSLGTRPTALLDAVRNRSSAPTDRWTAADKLAEQRHPRALEVLSAILQDTTDEGGTRTHVGGSLGKLGVEALPVLLQAQREGDREARQGAADGLGAVDDPAALAALTTALDDSEHLVRMAAAFSFGQWVARTGDARALELLLRALDDPNGVVRRSAISALRKLDDPRAREALQHIVEDDPLGEVRGAAAQAVGQRGEQGGLAAVLRRAQVRERRARQGTNQPFGFGGPLR